MNLDEVPCSHCRVHMLPWRGVFLCSVCDTPPYTEATWFRQWRYTIPGDE